MQFDLKAPAGVSFVTHVDGTQLRHFRYHLSIAVTACMQNRQ